ncbi:hypothetical protein P1S61_04175 [Streptomyces sp. ME08-AFT2]|uniref:hypothetical protein n=1 Tax=Streptomyces sp. ME08-AFT2 TaxID=3028683 RepID=UPI0029A2B5D1|nr:hypothetical protein [Streptomyces sp. ME08-AFT2]MDX3308316.1 hypothetical protein [Streptomyces sp. ME08-AFT2]
MAFPLRVAVSTHFSTHYSSVHPVYEDSMAEITVRGPDATCDLRQRSRDDFRCAEVRAVAQYRSHIAELSGFARARCPSDAD